MKTLIPSARYLVRSLSRAIKHQVPVTITYKKKDGTFTVRVIEPYEMTLSKSGVAIVKGLDRKTEQPRSFRIAEIRGLTVHSKGRRVLNHHTN